MKIKTITCHNVYNYGASLQAFALQTYLESIGHEVEIINYKPSYRKTNFWRIPQNSRVKKKVSSYILFHFLYALYRLVKYILDTNFTRKRKFDEFNLRYFHLTQLYLSAEELKQNPPVADVYIAGSDQIWNPIGYTGMDSAFYLNFGRNTIKRISYAASFGIENIPENCKYFIRSNIKKLNAISVRESTGLNILDKLGFSGTLVVDPVFLLTSGQWMNIINDSIIKKSDYILVYDFFVDDKKMQKMARILSKECGCKIFAINDNGKLKYADKNICDASPFEFLQYIANAKFVLSNSFHATCFSILFHKEFIVYPVERNKNSSRMKDLLVNLKIDNRYNVEDISFLLDKRINWDEVDRLLDIMTNKSIQFIKANLN